MARRTPDGPPPPPVVQRLRIQYAKRGRLRFTSHRDFARAFERALRRARIPMGYSAGFSPHPKISYIGAAPTGVASEAEYLEIGLAEVRDPQEVLAGLDAALPDGLDLVAIVVSAPGSLAERMQASHWHVELPGVDADEARSALAALLELESAQVDRLTKDGKRVIDVRPAIVRATVLDPVPAGLGDATPDVRPSAPAAPRAILDLVVRQVTPAVRPDDILAALRNVAGLALVVPPVAVRLAQGPVDATGAVSDPLAPDRAAAGIAP